MTINKRKKSVIANPHTTNASIITRFGALIIDASSVLIVFVLMFVALSAILDKTIDFSNIENQYKVQQINSKLFPVNSDKTDIDTSSALKTNELGEATYLYYTTYLTKVEGQEIIEGEANTWYFVNVLKINEENSYYTYATNPKLKTSSENSDTTNETEEEKSYAPYVPAGLALKENLNLETMKLFEKTNYDEAYKSFKEYSLFMKYSQNFMTSLLWQTTLLLIDVFIFYFTIPMFVGNGRTLGKMATGLLVVTNDGYMLTSGKLFIRAIAPAFIALMFLIIFNPTWMLIGFMLMFVSLSLSVFAKSGRSLHCLMSGTRVVKKQNAVVFENAQQYINSTYYVKEEEETDGE